jgi:hypothetical protein
MILNIQLKPPKDRNRVEDKHKDNNKGNKEWQI